MSHSMLLKSNMPSEATDMKQKTSSASEQSVKSMSQPTFQFTEGPVMDWTVDYSLYTKF